MTWPLASAITWSERAIALAVLLQTLELLQIREAYADTGIWRWSTLRSEHRGLPAPLRGLFALLLPYRSFIGLLIGRLLAASLLLGVGTPSVLPFLWLSQLAICVRFRGTFNGGSDAMTLLILMALSVAGLAPQLPLLQNACLLYIGVQLSLSYFVAGIAKLKEADWRRGAALPSFVLNTPYGAPLWARALLSHAPLSVFLSWGVMAFECLFPLSWADPRVCLACIAIGAGFHVANALVFGLNRFLFAWAAAYPALFYCSQWLAR
jgi:Vitamin K-dependent gamma-carboxylase